MKSIKKILKRFIIFFLIITLGLSTYIYFGLKNLEIEDRYGDLQDIYWNSKNGDIALNKKNSKHAVIRKERYRVYVIVNNKKVDLEEWLNPTELDYEIETYRIKGKAVEQNFTSTQLEKLVKSPEATLIEEISVKY